MPRKVEPISFKTKDELRILSAALCVAQDEASDGMYDAGDGPRIRRMKAIVDAELEARYAARRG